MTLSITRSTGKWLWIKFIMQSTNDCLLNLIHRLFPVLLKTEFHSKESLQNRVSQNRVSSKSESTPNQSPPKTVSSKLSPQNTESLKTESPKIRVPRNEIMSPRFFSISSKISCHYSSIWLKILNSFTINLEIHLLKIIIHYINNVTVSLSKNEFSRGR